MNGRFRYGNDNTDLADQQMSGSRLVADAAARAPAASGRLMRIGIDLDNTIVCYDRVLHDAAVARGILPANVAVSKRHVRDYLREHGQEDAWVELQGFVYGLGMRDAMPFAGVVEFFTQCAEHGISTCVISHRTRYPHRGPSCDLRETALEWLGARGLSAGRPSLIGPESVYFEESTENKLKRISYTGCDYFVDDLLELLDAPGFPAKVRRVLFDPNLVYGASRHYDHATSWAEITGRLVLVRDAVGELRGGLR